MTLSNQILYIYRRTSRFFSIENVFRLVSEEIARRGRWNLKRFVVPREGFSPSVLWANMRSVKTQKSNLYHITGEVHYLALVLPGKQTVLTIHDCGFMYHSAGLKRWLLKKLQLDWPVARCARITTISEHTRRQLLGFTGCPPDKIQVIPNPVSGLIQSIPRDFNTAKPVLLFVGITPNKNLPRVIEAIRGISCILEIIGVVPDEHRSMLEAATIEWRSLSNLSDEEMARRYTECDLVLFPSTYEGFGMPIIEGQKALRPVITSNLSPMKEVAGGAACLVDPMDIDSIRTGLRKVIEDNLYRELLVTRGAENVRQYELEHIAGKYQSLYQEICKEV